MYGSNSQRLYVPDEQKEAQEGGKPRGLVGKQERNCKQNIFYEIRVNELLKLKQVI